MHGRRLQKVQAWPPPCAPPVPSPCTLPIQGPARRTEMLAEPTPSAPQKPEPQPRPRERPVPTSQGFLQGLGEAGPSGAVAVIPAGVLPRREGQGRQMKVHESQVMTSHLDRRRESNRAGLRCFYSRFP